MYFFFGQFHEYILKIKLQYLIDSNTEFVIIRGMNSKLKTLAEFLNNDQDQFHTQIIQNRKMYFIK